MTLGDFSQQAEVYRRARPGYPAELVSELIAAAGVSPGDPVADIGAGTGIFTRLLAERGLVVTAIEPNAEMRRRAPELPHVTWRDGTFEATSLPDCSQRWAAAAQAFHWADSPRALPELRRALAPGGGFTALWNQRDDARSAVLAWTRELLRRHVPDFEQLYHDRDWSDVLTSTGDFTRVVRHEARHVVPMTRDRYLDLWRSNNHLNVAAGPERLERFLAEVAARLDRDGVTTVDVAYVCRAWTAS